MQVKEEHKALLRSLGLTDEDFAKFDGERVAYEFDGARGVRLYDPYYRTSYDEYIGIDGWSAWSSENDTFMSDIIEAAGGRLAGSETSGNRSGPGEISGALKKKFSAVKDGESS
jgi:hypothetical protein